MRNNNIMLALWIMAFLAFLTAYQLPEYEKRIVAEAKLYAAQADIEWFRLLAGSKIGVTFSKEAFPVIVDTIDCRTCDCCNNFDNITYENVKGSKTIEEIKRTQDRSLGRVK